MLVRNHWPETGYCLMFYSVCFCFFAGKDHVCRFIGCGRNEKFNYVVMQLQVSSVLLLSFCPTDVASQGRIYSERVKPSTGRKHMEQKTV